MAFIARQLDRVDLRNLASIGGDRLLTEWLASDPAATGTVSILSLPDYWIESGCAAMPRGVLYEGVKPGAAVDAPALWREHRALWESLSPCLDAAPPADPDAAEMLAYIRRHTARLANDLGVFFEDNGRKDLAIEAYRQTRRLDTNNVSALLNLAVLSRGGTVLPEAAAVERGLVALASDTRRLPLWRLAGTYGYVREPNAFAQSGWVWTFSGRRGLALANIKRAAAMGSGPADTGLRQMMAAVYLAQEDAEKSRQLYEQVLQTETNNVPAMIGLARIAIRAGNVDGATNWLGRAQAAGAPYAVLAIEKAAAHAQSGNVGEARAVLERLVERVPDATRAWALLAALRLQQGDQLGFDDSILRLRSLPEGELTAALLLAQRAFMEQNAETARREVATMLRLQPNHRTALEMQLSLDVSQGQVEQAKQHARVLLQHHPDNAMGYYILGSVQFKEGKTELAESSLRRSLALRRTEATLNDLAWLLNQRGAVEEAEQLVREALTMAPGLGNAWDTLGMILLRRGDKPAARAAIEKAIALAPQAFEYQLHFTELLFAEGNFDAVRASLPALDKHWNAFTLEQQQRLTEIRQAAEKAATPR